MMTIVTNRYVSEIELSNLFLKKEEKVFLRLFESNTIKTELKYYRMTKPVKKKIMDKKHYVSPVIP